MVLEGFHAVKHAVRFGAVLETLVSVPDITGIAESLAPDVEVLLSSLCTKTDDETFLELVPAGHPTGVAAIARRPTRISYDDVAANRAAPIVLLEDPRHPGNVGASVRIAAAAGAAGLIAVGSLDPWTPSAVRGAAGLHFALPVLGLRAIPPVDRPLWVFDPEGLAMTAGTIPDNAVLGFGTERDGVSAKLRSMADTVVSLPMEPGISSINLAAAVAVGLYAWRLGAG